MSPRLTIIGLHFAPEPTGNAPYTTHLATGLAQAGWTVTVVTGYPHYPQWQIYDGYTGSYRRETVGGVDVIRLRHYVPRAPRLLSRVLMELHFGFRASRVDWRKPDVILLVSPALFASAVASATAGLRHRRTPTAVWVQDIYARGLDETHSSISRIAAPVRAIEARVMLGADKVFVIHERFRKHMCDRLGLPEDSVQVLRNWAHISSSLDVDRAGMRQSFGWGADDVVVLHAGNMGLKQNLENVVEAARLAESLRSPVRFVLLGGGNQRPRLEALATGAMRLQFMDPLPEDEYAAALAAADVLLVNERPGVRNMSVPSKLTSYFTVGLPVLAAVEAESATADEVMLSGAGIVVSSGNPAALVEAAAKIGEDHDTASRMGVNGRRFAAEYLTPQAAIRLWDKALRTLAEG